MLLHDSHGFSEAVVALIVVWLSKRLALLDLAVNVLQQRFFDLPGRLLSEPLVGGGEAVLLDSTSIASLPASPSVRAAWPLRCSSTTLA